MADTITVLNVLTFTHAADHPFYDVDSATDSAVGTWAILIPLSASQARVIFRPKSALVAVRVRMTKVTSRTTPTKIETQILEWTSVSADTNLETGTIDVGNSFATNLHIDCCATEEGKTGDTDIIIEIASEAGVDDAWTTVAKFNHATGTGIEALSINENLAGDQVLSLNNPVASNFDNDGKFKFILDSTIANSEIIFQVSHTEDV